jgi:hypothetical protein
MRIPRTLAVLALLLPLPATAQTPGWVADPKTGCHVWNPAAPPNWTVTWSGACPDGLARGLGVLQWFADGNRVVRYEGGLLGGKLTGHGVMTFANGERRDAVWHDDKRNGHGVTTFPNGDRYDGEFRDDRMAGHGVLNFKSGNRYSGEWRDDRYNGHGTKTWASGDRYEGLWRDGRANGQGHLLTSDGAVYNGIWSDGCLTQGGGRIAIDVDLSTCP